MGFIVWHLLFLAGAFLIGVALAEPLHAPAKQSLFRATVTHPLGGYVGFGLIVVAVILGLITPF